MRLCKLSDIVGYEKLARPVMTKDYHELLAAGTELKPEYVSKLESLGITEVFIDDSKLKPTEVLILKNEVEGIFREKVKSVMERHVYNNSSELEELTKTADSIISNILEDEEIVEQIFDIKERSADIYEHSISVCSLAILVAAKMGYSKKELRNLGVASLFHDIGLRYLNFPYNDREIDSLSDKERIEYKKHPAYGFSALEKEKWISKESKTMILQHHERINGSGYPLHARNPEKMSQILEATDAFDEMICGIGCKRSKVYEAVEYLKSSRGFLFSKEVIDVLLDFTAVYPAGSMVKMSTGEVGMVIRQNKQFPERPVVRIVKDKDGKTIEEEVVVNLLDERTVYIENVVM